MDLFENAMKQNLKAEAPLALRMRPRNLDEFEGQQRVVGPGTLLRRAIEADTLQSVILFGPPGSGKTTLAQIIAGMTKANFRTLNAVMDGVKEIRAIVAEAEHERAYYGKRTLVFIDEIHRFNKGQQDALLPFVESGLITLVGATTENPMFTVNKALLSRSRIFTLEPLPRDSMHRLLKRALKDRERGLGSYQVEIEQAALEHLVDVANGDARSALNALELAVLSTPPDAAGVRVITRAVAAEAIQRRVVNYTRDGDEHYDVISAFIKSVRGSDPQAALYWLARMLYAGEDINFISRRLVILAAEDIGLADPQGLVLANAAAQAVERIGMPEARIILAEATVYLALAPKSNSTYLGIGRALRQVEEGLTLPVPMHLRDGGGGSAARLGYGRGYKYPHDYPRHWVEQSYLPAELAENPPEFYQPGGLGREAEMVAGWQERRQRTKKMDEI